MFMKRLVLLTVSLLSTKVMTPVLLFAAQEKASIPTEKQSSTRYAPFLTPSFCPYDEEVCPPDLDLSFPFKQSCLVYMATEICAKFFKENPGKGLKDFMEEYHYKLFWKMENFFAYPQENHEENLFISLNFVAKNYELAAEKLIKLFQIRNDILNEEEISKILYIMTNGNYSNKEIGITLAPIFEGTISASRALKDFLSQERKKCPRKIKFLQMLEEKNSRNHSIPYINQNTDKQKEKKYFKEQNLLANPYRYLYRYNLHFWE